MDCPGGIQIQLSDLDQTKNNRGQSGRKDSKGITKIKNRLNELEVTYTTEVRFSHCRDHRELPFDIMVIVMGRTGVIEYDGQQHFTPTSFGGSTKDVDNKLATQKTHDIMKNNFTKKHQISLLRISYRDDDYIQKYVDEFIVKMKSSSVRVDMFSNPNDYDKPYGKELDEGCLIQ